jgi:hypothetical protein
VINFYIQTPDARSFLSGPSQSQISAKLGLAMRRAAARDW